MPLEAETEVDPAMGDGVIESLIFYVRVVSMVHKKYFLQNFSISHIPHVKN